MSYELSSIELEVQQYQITKAFLVAKREKNKYNSDNPGSIKKEAYLFIIEKFKKYFNGELLRIESAVRTHKINDPVQVFTRYLELNYKGLLNLYSSTNKDAPPDYDQLSDENIISLKQNLVAQVHYHLLIYFLKPLKDFLESELKNDLIDLKLIESPVDRLHKSLLEHKVSITKHDEYVTEEYKSIYSNQAKRLFSLYYNGFKIESLYNEYLDKIFHDFLIYIDIVLERDHVFGKQLKFLEDLKARISSVHEFYYKTNDTFKFPTSTIKHCRKDACDTLRLNLHKYSALQDFDVFNTALLPLTEIQRIYINRSLMIIKHKINWVKIIKNEKHSKDHQNQMPSNQLELPLNTQSDSSEKLQWRGNINQLITFFYDASTQVFLNGEPVLKASKSQIVRILSENFIQKDGDPVNPDTVKTIFTPSKEQKRPPFHKRISIPL